MNTKYVGTFLCLMLALPVHALPNPYENNYGATETKEEFVELLQNDVQQAHKRADAGDADAYRYVAKRLAAGYKWNWVQKNPGKALLCIVGGVTACICIIAAMGSR